ncbi:MAG: hypothetical protein D3908_04740, partial [Candidatus Electrothrix sp. AUS4]|nr:hypothetical protein [Candidatus Electrothrix sp. AUS4]
MRNRITALSLTGLLSVPHAPAFAESPIPHQSIRCEDIDTVLNNEHGNIIINHCKDCCTDEKKRYNSLEEKWRSLNEQLPEAQLKKAQRLLKNGDKDASKRKIDSIIEE